MHITQGALVAVILSIGRRVCPTVPKRFITNLMVSKYPDNQTFGHLLKRAVMETHLQPTALRCQGVAFISILLTNI